MLQFNELGSKSQEIAAVITKSINTQGIEVTQRKD